MTTPTREELLKLAKEAGLTISIHTPRPNLERFAALLSAHQAQGEPPSGHAYRYRHYDGEVICFNDGREVNGSRPIETVPYWFAPPSSAQTDQAQELASPAAQSGAVDELPPLPHWWQELEKNDKVLAHQFKNHMEDYARAAVELARAQAAPDEVQAAEAKLYRDLTGDAMAMGYDGIPAALEALQAQTAPAVDLASVSDKEITKAIREIDALAMSHGLPEREMPKAIAIVRALSRPSAPVSEQPAPCGQRDYCSRHPFCGCGSEPAFPERDPSKPAEQQGLFRKFDVRRVDGSDKPGGKHYGCRYFVLDLDHDPAAPAGMRGYAAEVRSTHPKLADDIKAKFGEQPAAQTAGVPEGWKLVPIEPTKEMWDSVNKLDDEMAAGSYDGKGCSIEQAWNCLLAAAPDSTPTDSADSAPCKTCNGIGLVGGFVNAESGYQDDPCPEYSADSEGAKG